MNRIVLDTNVLVSALLLGGAPGKLIQFWQTERIHLLASREIMDEYLRVLTYPKFSLSEEEIHYLLTEEILPWVEVISVPQGKKWIPEDPEDDKFIWCALEGKARALVSGDKHLLKLQSCPVRILSPAQFLRGIKE
jgi:putative PIN family toxin of toxin-antitoxin system